MTDERLNTCAGCGKPLGDSADLAELEAREAGFCLECYEDVYKLCKECPNNLPKGRDLKSHTCRVMGYCLECYDRKFPERADSKPEDMFKPEIKEPSKSPWEWRESIQILYDEKDDYEG